MHATDTDICVNEKNEALDAPCGQVGRSATRKGAKPVAPRVAAVALSALLAASAVGVAGCTANGGGATKGSFTVEGSASGDLDQSALVVGTVEKHERFDAAVTDLTPEALTEAGFTFGDSCNISFSNGCTLTDVPYYNGYYVKKGAPVLVAYPKDPYVTVANNNAPLWSVCGLSDGDTVTITMNEPGKYRSTYEALAQSYSVDRADYATDEQFCNFRALSGGNLKENFLYRGASPVDNSRNRAALTDSLLEKNGIVDIIDLADTASNMEKYFAESDFSSNYTRGLYERGADVVLGMATDYEDAAYQESVAKGVRHLLAYGGPAYIHCMEGKDRTGFACILLEALAGASYEEMCADYMTTYANYYGITADGTPDRYDVVVLHYFVDFAEYMDSLVGGAADADVATLAAADYAQSARIYLANCGLSEDEIDQLVKLITK